MYVYTQFEFACKLGKLDEVQRKSVISFSEMSKDVFARVFAFFYEVKNASPMASK